jgi:hypothetical protein
MGKLLALIQSAANLAGSIVILLFPAFVLGLFASGRPVHPALVILLLIWIAGAIAGVVDSRCPRCRRFFTFSRSAKVLVKPSLHAEGTQRVTRRCSHCGYRQKYEEAVPKINDIEPP